MPGRIFLYDGKDYPDPDATWSVEDVRQAMSNFMPELANSETIGTKRGDVDVFEFRRRTGTKGGSLVCGCEISAGAPIDPEMVKEHKNHTLQVMFLWDLLVRHGATPEQTKARDALMMARIAYQEALDAAYPSE